MLELRRGEEDAEKAQSRAALRRGARADAGSMARTTSQLVSALAAARAHRPVTRPSAAAASARLGAAVRGSEGRAASHMGPGGRARTVRAVGTPLSRRGERGPRAAAPALTGAQRAGEAEEVSPARRGGSVRKVCFRRGLEPSLRGYFSFCLWRSLPGPSPGTGSRYLCPQQKQEVRALLAQLTDAPGLPHSLLAWSLRLLSWPGGCFSCLESALWHRHRCCGKPLGGWAGAYRAGERERDREEGF